MIRSLPSRTPETKRMLQVVTLLIKVLMSQTSDTQILLVRSPFLFNQITALQSTHMPSPDPLIIKTKTMSRYCTYIASRILHMHNVHRKKLNLLVLRPRVGQLTFGSTLFTLTLSAAIFHQMLIPSAFGVAFFWVTFRFVLALTDAIGITMKWLQPHTLCKISWTHYSKSAFCCICKENASKTM